MQPSATPRTRLHLARPAGAAVAGVLLALGLTACSGSGDSSSAGSSASSDEGGSSSLASRATAGTAAGASDAGLRSPAAPAQRPSVVKTGQVALTSQDIAAVRDRIDRLLAAAGGTVDTERSTNGRDGSVRRSTLVLRVPVARFESVKDALEGLGTLRSSTQTAEDVTTQVIDVRERVTTLRTSLDRLQRFQRSATDVKDLIRFEDDITQRTSELQSLVDQQSYLAGQTSMSTITVRLSTPAAFVAPKGALDDAGFLPGLRHGWDALVGFAVVGLTAAGAALPWLVVLAVLGVPAVLLRRRSRRPSSTGSTV